MGWRPAAPPGVLRPPPEPLQSPLSRPPSRPPPPDHSPDRPAAPASQGDHTILGSQRSSDGAPRVAVPPSGAKPLVPSRKTPSPTPASPTNTGSRSRTKTPPPPPMLHTSAHSSNERERRSPKSGERNSPTMGKGSMSPTEDRSRPSSRGPSGAEPRVEAKHGRSMSASVTPIPIPPNSPHVGPVRPLAGSPGKAMPRSKSALGGNASIEGRGQGADRVGCEVKKPDARRAPAVETRNVTTQTEGGPDLKDDVDPWCPLPLEDEPRAPASCDSPSGLDLDGGAQRGVSAGGSPLMMMGDDGDERPDSSQWLSQPLRMVAELEMALRSEMETIADHEATRRVVMSSAPSTAPPEHPMPPPTLRTTPPSVRARHHNRVVSAEPSAARSAAPKPSRAPGFLHGSFLHGRRAEGLRSLGLAGLAHGSGDSDGECHGEDDEVRSLSLSEDGPSILRRSFSEILPNDLARFRRAAPAPDPVAMLSDGKLAAFAADIGKALPAHANANGDDDEQRAEAPSKEPVDCADGSADGSSAPNTCRSDGTSAPNESDNSAAPTQLASAEGGADRPAGPAPGVFTSLLPILSKVTGHSGPQTGVLEAVPEQPGATNPESKASRPNGSSQPSSTFSSCLRPLAPLPVVRQRSVPATRVRAMRSAHRSAPHVQALDLSALAAISSIMRDEGKEGEGVRPTSARSDVSFGSACSAFTCWSSSSQSSSQITSPRHRGGGEHGGEHARGLKATVSMPSLHNHG